MKKYILYSVLGTLVITGTIVLISWRRKAANVALAFINQMEIGKNQGFANQVFEQMMKDVGWRGGEAWCMYFAKAVWIKAFPKKAELIKKYLTGSTQQSWKNALAHPEIFKVITDGHPMPGDIVIWQNVVNPTLGHAGIEEKRVRTDYYKTIEGNTNQAGVREGDGVLVNERRLIPGYVDGSLKVLGFIRLRL
jgi:hypothetical protein